jgi:hypothetical protein
MPGPPPSQNARRGNKRPDWLPLPPDGRDGPVPDFPLDGMTDELASVWAELWGSPQADAWEKLGWTRVVARYAKLLLVSEQPDAKVTLLAEVRQLEDRLGLSPMAMKRLQWEIREEPNANTDAEQGQPDNVANIDDYRELYDG